MAQTDDRRISNRIIKLKSKKQDIGIKELFRNKLENAEVIPGASVNPELMKKLGRKEFLRFNPSRFNIYYLGMIIAAAITAGLLIFSKPGDSKEQTLPGAPVDQRKTADAIAISAGQLIVRNEPDKKEVVLNNKSTNKKLAYPDPGHLLNREKNIVAQADVNLSGNELYNGAAEDKKLKINSSFGEVLFEQSVFSGCSPLKVHFRNKADLFDRFSWSFGDGGYSDKKDPEWIFDVEGQYKVVLKAYKTGGPTAIYSSIITVYPKPQARFETAPEKAMIPDDEIQFLNFSTNAITSKWYFGDGSTSDLPEPKHKYLKYGSYNVSLVLKSEYGCSDSLVVANAFSGSGYFIDMPNAFIPNSQGPSGGLYSSKSDEAAVIFHPTFSGVSEYQMKIFTKLGILIFESNDVNTGWDGYFKGQLSNPGVYIWKIRGNFNNGEPFIKMGDVTLLKN